MGASQTVLPFKLAATDESLTAQSGLALFGEYLQAMGVCGLIDHELPRPGSAAGYSPSVHVLPLVLMLGLRGRTLEDLALIFSRSLTKPAPIWRAAQSKSLSGHRRLAEENSLPERALNLGGMFCPLVGQELYGAGLILEQF
jgi:hypothetical protein